MSIGWWRRVLAAIAASACAVARDIGHVELTTVLSVLGVLAFLLMALAALEALVLRVPLRVIGIRPWRAAAVSAAVLPPYVFGLWRWFRARQALPFWTPFLFTAIATCGAVVLAAPFLWRHSPEARGRARAAYAILVNGGFVALHVATATLQAIRPGTQYLHLGLFTATMLASFALPFMFDARIVADDTFSPPSRVRTAVCALIGLAFMELDRRVLVDLYPAVHAWLGLVGLLSIETALILPLTTANHRPWLLAGGIGAAVTVALAAWLVMTRGGALGSIVGRAEAAAMPFGTTVLELMPRIRAAPPAKPVSNPALRYAQYLDDATPSDRYNILLVTVDALRADQVGSVTHPVRSAPSLQAFAETAVRFRDAHAQGPRTSLAMSSLLLGRYSANIDWNLWIYRHGRIESTKGLSDDELDGLEGGFVFTTVPEFRTRTLAERLKRVGYFTVAVPFAGENEFFRKGVGFDRGFDVFSDLSEKKWRAPSSKRVLDVVLRQIPRLKRQPWFLWIHFYDPHESRGDRARYDDLVHSFDDAFGRLLARMEPVMDRTAVIVLADHGEAFGEHRQNGHASSLYEEQTRIPILMRIPGVEPRDENQRVAAIDVAATVAVLGGADRSNLDGVNLLPLIREGRYPAHRPIFTELHRYLSAKGKRTDDMTAVLLDESKLIIDWQRTTAQLFRLDRDPGETKNLVTKDRPRFEQLYKLVENYRQNAEYFHPLP